MTDEHNPYDTLGILLEAHIGSYTPQGWREPIRSVFNSKPFIRGEKAKKFADAYQNKQLEQTLIEDEDKSFKEYEVMRLAVADFFDKGLHKKFVKQIGFNYRDTEKLINKIGDQPLSKEVLTLNKLFCVLNAPCIINGFCASDKDTFDKVAQYIAERTKIPNIRSYSFTQDANLINLALELQKNHKKENYLIKAADFHLVKSLSPHSYNQTIQQTCSNSRLKGLNLENPKKIIIVTNIDPSKENYDHLVREACSAQFQSFLYEF